jgi:FKBP-type peptidyl-prolyl cis-trans isomerase
MSRASSLGALLVLCGLGTAACNSPSQGGAAPSASAAAPSASAAPEAVVGTTVLVEGTGPACKKGDKVAVHYVGTLLDGSKFASSRDSNQPLTFTVGQRGIVRGMSQGVLGMKVGEKRKIVVPPSLAYGERSNDKIPPNSTLVYEVELLGIEAK